jgi:hypothetical protein
VPDDITQGDSCFGRARAQDEVGGIRRPVGGRHDHSDGLLDSVAYRERADQGFAAAV